MTPNSAYFYFDDHDTSRPQIGQRFIDHVRDIGPPIICTHKGISSIVGSSYELASPSDIGPAAARNPDVNFVVYHSGFEPGMGGVGPYDPEAPIGSVEGVDRLIRSLQDNGVEPNANVYAELGGTWWYIMRDPTVCAHVLGKLLALRRRGPGGVGHRLDLVRHPAGPDPDDADLRDLRASSRRATATPSSRRR